MKITSSISLILNPTFVRELHKDGFPEQPICHEFFCQFFQNGDLCMSFLMIWIKTNDLMITLKSFFHPMIILSKSIPL